MVEQLIAEINTRWPLPEEAAELDVQPQLKLEQYKLDGKLEWSATWDNGEHGDQDPQAYGATLEDALQDLKRYLEEHIGLS